LEKALSEKEALVATTEQQCQKAYADLGMATRMHALLQADLNDLRSRFESAQEIRVAQEALLAKLTPQLQQAADQLRRLQFDEDESNPLIISAAASLLGSEPSRSRGGKRSRSERGSDVSSTTR
jgi:predicted nuclease with TOPRIM domain